MRSREFRDRLQRRSRKAGVAIPEDAWELLEAYFDLLARWNRKINLTALPLDPPTDQSFDRLLIEPLAAARYVRDSRIVWVDLGSGGGSPAIPLKIVRLAAALTMVESKARKAAFLREAIRTLRLSEASVLNVRFESIPADWMTRVELVTLRAVRVDAQLAQTAGDLLRDEGELFLFRSSASATPIPSFKHVETVQLAPENSFLSRYRYVPRGTKQLT